MNKTIMGNMKYHFGLMILLLDIAYGSPYFYHEDKHHSEMRKEYSYNNGQPSSLNVYEPSPQKYFESSQVTPERYYKVETNPLFSGGYSQYSGGQSSFHQSGFQSSSGIRNGHLIPHSSGQSLNVDGIIPGTYVIKQVKVYRHPSIFTTQTGFYGSSSHSSQLGGSQTETGRNEEITYTGRQHEENDGQKEMSLDDGQHEENLGQKEISLYDGQHEENLGQKEISLYDGQHEETLGQKEISLYDGQHEEELNGGTGEYFRQVQTSLNNKAPAKHEESWQKLITKDFHPTSNIGKQIEVLTGQQKDFSNEKERGDLQIGQDQDNLNAQTSKIRKTIQTLPANNRQGDYKYFEKKVITDGAPPKDSRAYKQTYIRNDQRHELMWTGESDFRINQEQTTKKPLISYPTIKTESKKQTEPIKYSQEPAELGKNLTPLRSQTHYSNEEKETPKFLFGKETDLKSQSGSLEVGQQEVSLYDHNPEDMGQQLVSGSLEVGQQPDCEWQQQENENIGQDRKEGYKNGQQIHTWQKQTNTSTLEISGQRTEPLPNNFGQQSENMGQLQIESSEIGYQQNSYNKPQITVKQNMTRTLIVGHNLPKKPSLGKQKKEDILGQREDSIHDKNLETVSLELEQKEENVGQLETSNFGIGQEETLQIGQQSENMGQQLETGDLMVSHKEVHLPSKIPENYNLELGQKEEKSLNLQKIKGFPHPKLTQQPSAIPSQHVITSYIKQESHYHELKQDQGREQKDILTQEKKLLATTPSSANQESYDKNYRKNYFEMQRKAEELALQLGLEDVNKEKSSQQERDLYEKKLRIKESTSTVYPGEIQELGFENQHPFDMAPDKKVTSWETHRTEYGLHYPLPANALYSSKKHSEHYNENYAHNTQPIIKNHHQQEDDHQLSHYSSQHHGYPINGRERTYISDQPIQRTQTSGSQFSFSSSSSGSSQDKHKVIDDFLKELDKDIGRNSYQQRQQQGSYAEITPLRSGTSGVNYYSQRSISTHRNSSYSSSGTKSEGDREKSWYQKIGESIGSNYNQAKDRAKELVKSVKQSVGYSDS